MKNLDNFENFVSHHKMVGLQFEQFLFRTADRFSADYDGGHWDSCQVEGFDGFYLDLDDGKSYEIQNTENYYDAGPMESKTFSLAIFAYALNIFGFDLLRKGMKQSDNFFNLFHYIMQIAPEVLDEEEQKKFYAFLD